jgi:hypothetical protein
MKFCSIPIGYQDIKKSKHYTLYFGALNVNHMEDDLRTINMECWVNAKKTVRTQQGFPLHYVWLAALMPHLLQCARLACDLFLFVFKAYSFKKDLI